MSDWTDRGRPLSPNEIRRLLRDACAMLGKCSADTKPATLLAKSPADLHFDDPPLRNRPHHQKRALSYVIVLLFDDANIFISPTDFPADYFVDKTTKPLEGTVDLLWKSQEYPSRV